MGNVSPPLTPLISNVRDVLLGVIKPKFNAYFAFTPKSACPRSDKGRIVDGKVIYIYSNPSMISDLTVLWSLFCEVYESFKNVKANLANYVAANLFLQAQIRRIIEEGEYWKSVPKKMRSLHQVSLADAVPGCNQEICRVLRNGYAHFHWTYDDLSALDYWSLQGWDTKSSQTAFDLQGRKAGNYKAYIVDAKGTQNPIGRWEWNPTGFWDMKDLRIIVTPFHILRLHLYLFLNFLLTGSTDENKLFTY